MEYDLIVVFEAWEVSRDSIERLFRANRNHVMCRYYLDLPLHPDSAAETGCIDNRELIEAGGGDWQNHLWLKHHTCRQQIIMDTNPGPEFHHVNRMAAEVPKQVLAEMKAGLEPRKRVFKPDGKRIFTRILSRHGDNPACTRDDMAKLDAMTGHRKERLRFGLWTSAEGLCWPELDVEKHLVTARVCREGERDERTVTGKRKMWLEVLEDSGETRKVQI
jgi:hypothetical protein